MDIQSILAKKQEGKELSTEELTHVARGAATGDIPDYQLAAWLTAVAIRGLSGRETADLTLAMANTGQRMDLSSLPKPWVDKHSTGGVGDKTTLVLMPLLAACGVTMIKMSGRGLGITGGTVDKLASIPGFRTDLPIAQLLEQAGRIGLAITSQTPDLAPADGVLYALRDVTATVDCIPLIVSSILSKKIAGGAELLVMDVKCGSGAFMRDIHRARELAASLVEVGGQANLRVLYVITDMDQPLGASVGNALEVAEALQVLSGEAEGTPSLRFRELCIALATDALFGCGKAESAEGARSLAESALTSGSALRKAEQWITAQGGNLSNGLPTAPIERPVRVHQAGWISHIDARTVGQAVMGLGGGRNVKSDKIDPSVGVVIRAIVGDRVHPEQEVMTIHASSAAGADAAAAHLAAAVEVSSQEVPNRPLILG